MLASLHYATEKGLSNPAEVDAKLNEVGVSYSRARADVKRSTKALENMKPLQNGGQLIRDIIEEKMFV